MLRKGFVVNAFLVLIITFGFPVLHVVAAVGNNSGNTIISPPAPPKLVLPHDTTYRICGLQTICFDVSGSHKDKSDSLTLSLLSGPINFEPLSLPSKFTTQVCFDTDTAGVFEFVFELREEHGLTAVDTVVFTVLSGDPPVLSDQQFGMELCNLREDRVLSLSYNNPAADWRFRLLSGVGNIDSLTGTITYRPDTSGTFVFEVEAFNDCGADTARITDEVILNLPPYCIGFDTTITLCGVQEVCFDVIGHDPEGDSITIMLLEGPGSFTQTDDTTGQSCFLPADVEVATYSFIYRTIDSCVLATTGGGGAQNAQDLCCLDTVNVTVIIDNPPALVCPDSQSFFACQPDSLSFDIDYFNEASDSTFLSVISGPAVINGKTVTVAAAQAGQFDVVIAAEDDCGADTCTVPVRVTMNQAPFVSLADDFDLFLCQSETVCFPATIDDFERNLDSVTINYGYFDPVTSQVCFDADTAGVYEIIATAADTCGAVTSDTTLVTIDVNHIPTVSLGDDFSVKQCESGEICIDVLLSDENTSSVTTTFGIYKADSGTVCFIPDTSGVYTVGIRVEDFCGEVATDTVQITVDVNSPPTISNFNDTTLYLCYPQEVCLAPEIFDGNDDIAEISLSGGYTLDSLGRICFVPYNMGVQELILSVTDSCGVTAVDTAIVTIKTDQGIALDIPNDTTIELCTPDTLCFPVGGIPEGAQVKVGGTNVWWDEATQSVCFYSDCCLENIISVEVTTECGTYSGQFTVNVRTNSSPLVILPPDTAMLLCGVTNICLPAGISDVDNNLRTISTSFGYYDDFNRQVCFTADTAGTYTIGLTAVDSCGAEDYDEIVVSIDMNSPPVVTLSLPELAPFCVLPDEIAVPYSVLDVDDNVDSVVTSLGIIDSGTVRFTPDRFGDFELIVTAFDSCGFAGADTVTIPVLKDSSFVTITCPEIAGLRLCAPDSVCVDLTSYIDGIDYSIAIDGEAVFLGGQLCFAADTSGLYSFTLIGSSNCNSDTCVVVVPVSITPPLVIENCPVDSQFFLCGPDTLVFPLSLTGDPGPDGGLSAVPPAYISGDTLFVPVLQPGTQRVTAIASSGMCGDDTCSFILGAVFNTPPTISGQDTSLTQCDFAEVCVPFLVDDIDSNLADVISTLGSVTVDYSGGGGKKPVSGITRSQFEPGLIPSQLTGTVCFTPDAFGQYEIVLTAADSCGAQAMDTLTVTVNPGQTVTLTPLEVPADTVKLCNGADSVCLGLGITGSPDSIIVIGGSLGPVNSQVCFFADSSGHYVITAIGYAECNTDTAVFSIDVDLVTPASVVCPGDTAVFLCDYAGGTDTLVFPVDVTGDFDSVYTVSSSTETFWQDGFLYMVLSGPLPQRVDISVFAGNACGTDSCSFGVDLTRNTPPVLTLQADTVLSQCVPEEVCVKFGLSDLDDNVIEVRTTLGLINDSIICFAPDSFGVYEMVVTATDSCGASDTDSLIVTLEEGSSVSIECPTAPITAVLDLPDTLRVPVGILPADNPVSVSPFGYYDNATGELVAYVSAAGIYDFQLVAAADCNTDSCQIQIEVNQYQPPLVVCQGSIDTALCLLDTQTVCMPVTVSGTGVQVDVAPGGFYDTSGFVCLPVDTAGTYRVRIIASNDIQADTCFTSLTITRGTPPTVNLPDSATRQLCEPGNICLSALVSDSNLDIMSIVTNVGTFDSVSGELCFFADTAGLYIVTLTAVDSCSNVTSDTSFVTVGLNDIPFVEIQPISPLICSVEPVCVPVTVSDLNLMSVTTNLGQFDSVMANVCFLPEAGGNYTLIVEATDSCGVVVADTTDITVTFNQPPRVSGLNDTTVYLCYPQAICFTPEITDPDNNLVSVSTNRGPLDSAGQVCFVPYSMGDYAVIVSATDSCGLTSVDTATVTVVTDQGVQLQCPPDTSIFLCQPDTLCFPIDGIPANATVAVGGTNTWWDEATQSVCFYSDCCLENIITVDVTTPCGTYSCQFTVNVRTNSKPLVILPQDTSVVQCQLEPFCLPVGISDIDKNLFSVSVTGATYDDFNNEVCLTPDSAGSYKIVVVAVDSCGLSDTDIVVVDVKLNQAPVIVYSGVDSVLSLCTLSEICLPLSVGDGDDNLADVTVIGGTYNAGDSTICFTPQQFGTYCFSVVATDTCGLKDSLEVCLEIKQGDYVSIECPADTIGLRKLCVPAQICLNIPVTGNSFTVTTDFGSWANDTLCFTADSSGDYTITLVASSQCNSDTCAVRVPVQILDPVAVTCPGDTSEFLGGPDTLFYSYSFSNAVDSVRVSPPAFLSGDSIGVPILQAGSQLIKLVGTGPCGSDSCEFTVSATFNGAPGVNLGPDTTFVECSLFEICLPISITDVDSNIVSIQTSAGEVRGDSLLCFTPPGFGTYDLVVTVTDAFGLSDVDTVSVTINEGSYASIFCPDDVQFASICGPSEVCVVAPVSPADAKVTILPSGTYNPTDGTVCVFADSGGTYQVTVIAEAQCSTDTCTFTLEVSMAEPPALSCPNTVDTMLCLTRPDTLCIPIEVTGTGVQVTVSPVGYYSAGLVCVPVTQAGIQTVTVAASGLCGDTTCKIDINVSADQPPVLTLPTTVTVERCPDDTELVCIDGIFADDPELQNVIITQICGPGAFTSVTGDSGEVCFLPPDFGSFEFCFEATDGCNTVSGSFFVDVVQRPDCDVCVRVTIDGGKCTPVGLRKTVAVNVETNDRIGGFDLLISYDASALSFQNATITGAAIESWEYFTWNVGSGACGTACPSGLVRFVGIADQNDGQPHPPDSAFDPDGALFFIEFQVANDQNLGNQFVPVSFVWYDCADNSFSDPTGALLYVDTRIFNAEKNILWDENDDISFPETSRPFGMGAPDNCLVGGKEAPLRCIEFINGGVCIIHPDSIDSRGDINLNGLAYEIADVVIFTNYFIKGLSAFTINIAGQIAATDVNADGLTLTVADLSYLIRVVVGDANPIPKTVPYPDRAQLTTVLGDGTITVTSETYADVGAAYLVYQIDPSLEIGQPQLTSESNGMDLIWAQDGDQLKMLLYNLGTRRLTAGSNELISIPYSGEGNIVLVHSEIADYQGRPYEIASNKISLPSKFSLDQNYPNPFNPTTTISFALPHATDWTLRIYNVNGKLVREIAGQAQAGTISMVWDGRNRNGSPVASGVYFYRLDASEFHATRKMILLK